MGLKFLGVFGPALANLSGPSGILITLAVQPSLHLFYLLGLSLSKIITWAGTCWSRSLSVDFTEGFSKKAKIGEARGGRSGWGQRRKVLRCVKPWVVDTSAESQPQFGAEAAFAGAVGWHFELRVSMSPSACSGCAKVPRIILDSKTLEWVSRRNSAEACISTAWAVPYVRNLFLNHQLNFFSAEVAFS